MSVRRATAVPPRTLLMALRNARALASTVSVDTPRALTRWPWTSTVRETSATASVPSVTASTWNRMSLASTPAACATALQAASTSPSPLESASLVWSPRDSRTVARRSLSVPPATAGSQEAAQQYAGNLPAAPGTTPDPVVIGERVGMFGASNGQDTTGYGGLRSPILLPGASQRPYGGYFDEVADTLERALVGGSASFAEAVEWGA